MEVITLCSFKGGTAKTSTCLHMAYELSARHGKRVLLIDFDSQANLSVSLGFGPDRMETMALVLTEEKLIDEVILQTEIPKLDLIPANAYLDGIERTSQLAGDPYAHERLKRAAATLKYDYVFIDTPPSLGWLTQSAFFASNRSVICAIPEAFSVIALRRLKEFHEGIQKYHPIELLGVVLSFWNERGAVNQAFLDEIQGAFPGLLFEAKIRRDMHVSRAVLSGKPVQEFAPKCRASEDYEKLGEEFLSRVEVVANV